MPESSTTQQWEQLQAAHAAAHDAYSRIHQRLSRRIREAARGVRFDYPLSEDMDAHMAASEALLKAQLALHDFCKQHAEYC